ncbi:class I SAM-dependent methyltransferase [Alicyclobacillus mengziensis]|uniref:SAM-dependent methyltransferase n=1 Tax=Alicyclobacillus mengziensis TaxID=2931921 RepID=A0A9X7Z449_9BACL|nr:SAM-dependent methyltransferase [Alicyclobacillus mengziensis]QSO45619.1 SAM-dependent methyltransferase [Alicyclobacillus mengziensis]
MMTNTDLRVVVGSGGSKNNIGWLHTEENELNLLKHSDWDERFAPNSIAVILAEHVWEHLTYEEGIDAAKTCYEFLQPGGYVRCAVPDGFFRNERYQNMVKVGGPGPADHPAASHKIVHTYRTLKSVFEAAGFQVHLLERCDENGDFHYDDWDENAGFIYRSKRFDHRNQDGELGFVSLIVDAIKPQEQ